MQSTFQIVGFRLPPCPEMYFTSKLNPKTPSKATDLGVKKKSGGKQDVDSK